MLSCVVKFIVLNSPLLQCCLCALASSHGSETGEKWFHGVLHGPSLQSTDRPVDVVNQPKTCYGEAGCASKKCWYTESSPPPTISASPDAGHASAHMQYSCHHTELGWERRYTKRMCAAGKSICVQALFVLTSEWERVRQSLNLLFRATSPNLKDKLCSETAAIIKYELVQNVTVKTWPGCDSNRKHPLICKYPSRFGSSSLNHKDEILSP